MSFGKKVWNEQNQKVQMFLCLIGAAFVVVAWFLFSNDQYTHTAWSVLITILCWTTAANIQSEWIDRPE